MKKMICIVMALIMCVSISASAATELLSREEIPLLSDDSHEIAVLKALGIMNGRPEGMELDKEVTRAEAVMLIWRVSGISFNDLGYEIPAFGDIKGHWAYDAIEKFYRAGLIDGTGENTFEPDRDITGKEFVKILLAALGFEVKSLDEAEKLGLEKGLLTDNYTKNLVKQNMTLRRSDAARFCYAAFLVKTADGKMLYERHSGAKELLTETSQAEPCFADKLNGYMPDEENYMFSPLSIKMALAMAANGAEGETREEILKTVGIEDLDGFNEKSRKMIDSYKDSGVLDVNISNSIWVKEDWDFSKEYRDTVSRFYDAEAEKVNDSDAVERINKWAEEKTNGKIPSVINDSNFDAALINAVYFKGYWFNQFDEDNTKADWFTSRDWSRKRIDFMNQITPHIGYATDGNITIAELPYKRYMGTGDDEILTSDNDVSMYLIMGETDEPVRLINETELTYGRAQLSVPKFKVEYSADISDELKDMGIKKAWGTDAEFEKMFEKDNMFIDKVCHKTYISVDENGTEAAAVTVIAMGGSAMIQEEPVELIFDRPFTFVIKDKTNDEILFIGEYAYAK